MNTVEFTEYAGTNVGDARKFVIPMARISYIVDEGDHFLIYHDNGESFMALEYAIRSTVDEMHDRVRVMGPEYKK